MSEFQFAELKQVVESCAGADSDSTFDESAIDTPFNELGIDSLAIYEIASKLQDDLKISIADEEVDGLKTPRKVIELVKLRLMEAAGQR